MNKKQRTPKGEEILIPKRKDFDAVLGAVATPVKKPIKKPPAPKPSRIRRPKK